MKEVLKNKKAINCASDFHFCLVLQKSETIE